MAHLQAFPGIFSYSSLHGGSAPGHTAHDIIAATATSAINPTQIGLLIGGIVILLIVGARHKRTRMAAGKSISRSDHRRGKALGDETLREVEAVMAQLDQLSRQIYNKIDLKLATLQKLTRDADQRIDQLARLERGARDVARFDVELESETPDPPGNHVPEGPNDAVYRLADSGHTPLQIARELARHTGEVELILSLRRTRNASGFGSPSIHKQAS